jgi:hypothetical protein
VTDEERDDTARLAFVQRVMEIFWHADVCTELMWYVEDGVLCLSADVSDIFAWGSADSEEITPQTLPVLEEAFRELKALGSPPWGRAEWLPELYAARVRGMRPQGAAYPEGAADGAVAALLDACGPARETGLGNPKKRPVYEGES